MLNGVAIVKVLKGRFEPHESPILRYVYNVPRLNINPKGLNVSHEVHIDRVRNLVRKDELEHFARRSAPEKRGCLLNRQLHLTSYYVRLTECCLQYATLIVEDTGRKDDMLSN